MPLRRRHPSPVKYTKTDIRYEAGVFRVFYLARRPESIYVLHAFQKKTQRTSPLDIELAKRRLDALKERQP